MIDAETVALARAVRIEDEIARRRIPLRGRRERVGPCPVHGGTDRFSVKVPPEML
jgi:Zinc-binding domain of primase-helicase